MSRHVFRLHERQRDVEVPAAAVVLCGYTARDEAGVRAHIEELAHAGVPAPASVPAFWRVAPELVCAAETIVVRSSATSGEVEPVLVRGPSDWHLAVGSDHTDRALEREDLSASKAACVKPVSHTTWPLADVVDRWDELELRSEVRSDGAWRLYQAATLAELRPIEELLELASAQAAPEPGLVLFLGTPPLRTEGFVYGDAFRLTLRDPGTGASLACAYEVEVEGGGQIKPEIEFRPVETFAWTAVRNGVSGLDEAILARAGTTEVATRMLRFAPGTDTTPAGVQVHDFWEEVYVVSGELHDLTLGETFTAGSYACRPPGMRHGPWTTEVGCTTFEVRYRVEATGHDRL
jgi:hypothetical protein